MGDRPTVGEREARERSWARRMAASCASVSDSASASLSLKNMSLSLLQLLSTSALATDTGDGLTGMTPLDPAAERGVMDRARVTDSKASSSSWWTRRPASWSRTGVRGGKGAETSSPAPRHSTTSFGPSTGTAPRVGLASARCGGVLVCTYGVGLVESPADPRSSDPRSSCESWLAVGEA